MSLRAVVSLMWCLPVFLGQERCIYVSSICRIGKGCCSCGTVVHMLGTASLGFVCACLSHTAAGPPRAGQGG